MKCSESLQQKIEALAAGELSGIAARGVGLHARRCNDCASRLSEARALNVALRGMAEGTPSNSLRDRVFDAMLAREREAPAEPNTAKVREATDSSAGVSRTLQGRRESRPRRLRTRRTLVMEMAAVMGTCAVVAAILFSSFAQSRDMTRGKMARAENQGPGPVKVASRYTQDYDETAAKSPAIALGGPRGNMVEYQAQQAQTAVGGGSLYDTNARIKDAAGEGDLAPSAMPFVNTPPKPTANTTPAAPDRYLIRNATLIIEVKDARAGYNTLATSVKAAKGYLSNLVETVDALGARTVTMQVRVPATHFDSSMQQLGSLGKVMSKNVTAEDVTEEYVDTESTLRNLNRTEARLLEHLGRTGRLSDTLLVEKELTRVRAEIEQREGRLRFLSHRVSFSTMDITLQEAAKSQPAMPPQSYSSGKEASDASRSLVAFLRSVWTTVIWIGIWAVVWAPLTFLALFGARKVWRAWVDAGNAPNL